MDSLRICLVVKKTRRLECSATCTFEKGRGGEETLSICVKTIQRDLTSLWVVEAMEGLGSWKRVEVPSVFSPYLPAHSSSACLFPVCILYNEPGNVNSVSLRSGGRATMICSWSHRPPDRQGTVQQSENWLGFGVLENGSLQLKCCVKRRETQPESPLLCR